MITSLDRILLTVPDRRAAARAWERLVGAEEIRQDHVAFLAARRTVLRVGTSEVELLEADGLGATAQHVARSRNTIFAVGLTTPDPEALRARLDARAVHHVVEDDQTFVTGEWLGIPGLRIVVGPEQTLAPAGLLSRLYETTHLVADADRAAARIAETFDVDANDFVPIESKQYGYRGALTLFRAGHLDRIETVTPHDTDKTMGRFFLRRGPCLYMCYAESDHTAEIRDRALEHAPADWTGPKDDAVPDNLFLHPRALEGPMLGVSRTSYAWTWSGDPGRVRPAPA